MKKLFENWNMFLNQKMEINENEAAMLRRLSRDNPTGETQETVDGSSLVNALRDRIRQNPDWSWMLDPDVFNELPKSENYYPSMEELRKDLNNILSTYSGTTLEDWDL